MCYSDRCWLTKNGDYHMNIAYISLREHIFDSLGYRYRKGWDFQVICSPYLTSWGLAELCPGRPGNFHLFQECVIVLFYSSSTTCYYPPLTVSIMDSMVGVRRCPVVLSTGVEHLIMCLLDICSSSLEKNKIRLCLLSILKSDCLNSVWCGY